MAGSRRWYVESKEFEVLVKEGVGFYERSNGKQRSIFIQKDELAWLVKIVEELVAVESSEVFWDQSRAGYPRIIAQRRSNRHGCFLTVEEFDGRCGNILILGYGQGWEQLIVEVRMASFSLHEASKGKKDKEGKGRSYAEVLVWKEPFAGTKKAQEDVSPAMASANQIPVRFLCVYPKPRKNTGKAPMVPTSHLSERLSAVNSERY